jgi:glycosyltransferase involved in cell wall biosynthesis
VENYLFDCDLYVHSAIYEAFGLVLIEAMAAGLPVVCLDGKGNRAIMEDGKNGFIVYEQNAEMFAGKILELVNTPGLYPAMSIYAKEYAKKYDIKEYVDKLVAFYKENMLTVQRFIIN